MGIDDRETTPPVNILRESYEDLRRWSDEWLTVLQGEHVDRREGESCVDHHKRKLGTQSFCWVGGSQSRRFHVWDRPQWRIFVHNVQGVTFEVPVDATVDGVWKAMEDYRRAMEG